ncbi:hypothetical protein SNEBB_004607 [Seison nebaliae]|nr:hypothetical protein SNEBB_004607 [Seison nebaliae]
MPVRTEETIDNIDQFIVFSKYHIIRITYIVIGTISCLGALFLYFSATLSEQIYAKKLPTAREMNNKRYCLYNCSHPDCWKNYDYNRNINLEEIFMNKEVGQINLDSSPFDHVTDPLIQSPINKLKSIDFPILEDKDRTIIKYDRIPKLKSRKFKRTNDHLPVIKDNNQKLIQRKVVWYHRPKLLEECINNKMEEYSDINSIDSTILMRVMRKETYSPPKSLLPHHIPNKNIKKINLKGEDDVKKLRGKVERRIKPKLDLSLAKVQTNFDNIKKKLDNNSLSRTFELLTPEKQSELFTSKNKHKRLTSVIHQLQTKTTEMMENPKHYHQSSIINSFKSDKDKNVINQEILKYLRSMKRKHTMKEKKLNTTPMDQRSKQLIECSSISPIPQQNIETKSEKLSKKFSSSAPSLINNSYNSIQWYRDTLSMKSGRYSPLTSDDYIFTDERGHSVGSVERL